MQVGTITVDGRQIGVVAMSLGGTDATDTFVPDLEGYEPQGRADRSAPGGPSTDHAPQSPHHRHRGTAPAPTPESEGHRPERHAPSQSRPDRNAPTHHDHEMAPRSDRAPAPEGKTYDGGRARPAHQGSAETDEAIVEAARAHNLDVNTMRGIASIESSMNPSSNANRSTQYKGLYQIGRDEWRRFGGGGNIYSARENAMAAARMFEANRNQFRRHFGRDPTDTELYMMHQQGLGFYTRGAMTNIQGNLPRSEHGRPQTHESFEAVWGRELARHKSGFAGKDKPAEKKAEVDKPFDPETMAP